MLRNGMTDFYEIQRRTLMTDPFKIQLASTKYPASFVAYDIIYDSGKMTIDLPLMERKKILQETVVENEYHKYIEVC